MVDENFLLEMQKLHIKMKDLVREYEMEDIYTGIWVSGFHSLDDYGEPAIKAMYSMNVDSREELNQILDFVYEMYDYEEDQSGPPDIDGLLGELGISLN